MAANLADHQMIRVVQTVSGNSPKTLAINEKAGQTFKAGTPVQLTAGVVLEWDGATVANGILGITTQDGSNLATDGKGAPGAFGSVGAPGTSTTFGSVPYQTSAVNIPHGAPMSDGRTVVELADLDTVFEAQVDNSAGGAYATAQAQIGGKYGLTKDASGHWYVDLNKANAVIIQAINPIDGVGVNGGRVFFTFLQSAQQLFE